MLCANYYTSVIKNLLPPHCLPTSSPVIFLCANSRKQREEFRRARHCWCVPSVSALVLQGGAGGWKQHRGGISGQGTRHQHPAACLFLGLVCEAVLSPLMALLAFSARLVFVLAGRILVELHSLFQFVFERCPCPGGLLAAPVGSFGCQCSILRLWKCLGIPVWGRGASP